MLSLSLLIDMFGSLSQGGKKWLQPACLEKLLYLLKLGNVGQVGYRFTDIQLFYI